MRPRRAWKGRESNLTEARPKYEVHGDLFCRFETQLFCARVNVYVRALLVCLFLLQTVFLLQVAMEGGFNGVCFQKDPQMPFFLSSLWCILPHLPTISDNEFFGVSSDSPSSLSKALKVRIKQIIIKNDTTT